MEAAAWKSGQGLRGDYTGMGAGWTVPQSWDDYGTADHAIWRRLCTRQNDMVKQYAAPEYLDYLAMLDFGPDIPRFRDINGFLKQRSGWEIVGVPGFLPDDIFFHHLAERRFPVTVWIRKAEEFDYIVEPDLFHDLFGHVPLLANPVFADFMQLYGQRAGEAQSHGCTALMGRLYWYGVEFGLIRGADGCKAYGAGLLSSPGEIVYALEDPAPHRVPFDILRCLRTGFKIDDYQKTYFVIDDYDQLLKSFDSIDLIACLRQWKGEDPLDPAIAYAAH